MSQWSSARFHRLVSGRLNSPNFLDYNEKSGKNYIQSYVLVYRKNKVKISYQDWKKMHDLGLFDPLHVIGAYPLSVITRSFLKHLTCSQEGTTSHPNLPRKPNSKWSTSFCCKPWRTRNITQQSELVVLIPGDISPVQW